MQKNVKLFCIIIGRLWQCYGLFHRSRNTWR